MATRMTPPPLGAPDPYEPIPLGVEVDDEDRRLAAPRGDAPTPLDPWYWVALRWSGHLAAAGGAIGLLVCLVACFVEGAPLAAAGASAGAMVGGCAVLVLTDAARDLRGPGRPPA